MTGSKEKLKLAVNPVNEIRVHKGPDADDFIATFILMTYGESLFPGVSTAAIKLVDPGETSEEDFDTLLSRKILCIGFGGGPFDEHGNNERLLNESAASLVANVIGVSDISGIREMVKYATEKDHSAETTIFELAPLVKSTVRFVPDNDQYQDVMCQIFGAVFLLLRGFLEQRMTFDNCEKDYKETLNIATVNLGGKKFRIVSVVSSNPEMPKYCRSSKGGYAAVAIVRQENGNTQIYFDHQKVEKDATAAVVEAIRIAERRKNGLTGRLPHQDLMRDGTIAGAEAWYYEYEKWLILNGSLTRSRPPTKLSREEVECIVFNALNDYFDRIGQ